MLLCELFQQLRCEYIVHSLSQLGIVGQSFTTKPSEQFLLVKIFAFESRVKGFHLLVVGWPEERERRDECPGTYAGDDIESRPRAFRRPTAKDTGRERPE